MKKALLVISSYPEKGFTHGKKTVGVAPYTKNVLLGMLEAEKNKDTSLTLSVLAERFPGQDTSYEEQGITVHRVWERNNPVSWLHLTTKAIQSPIKDVLIAYELAMFGRVFSLIFLPVLLFVLALFGKKVTVMLHHVATDFEAIQGHINTPKVPLVNMFGTALLKAFYGLIIVLVGKVVVFDQILKEQLGKSKKITVIEHGVQEATITLTNRQAREKLTVQDDEFVLVLFGYLAWYKGTDWVVEAVKALPDTIGGKKIKLIIAGGPNPQRLDLPFYRAYVAKLENMATESNGKILITGYVPEEQIGLYYQAADCLVFPYRTVFSASGPLSFAFSYKKPFLFSQPMQGITKTEDFAAALQKEKLAVDAFIFSLTNKSLQNKVQEVIENKNYRSKIIAISADIARSRTFVAIGSKYLELLS